MNEQQFRALRVSQNEDKKISCAVERLSLADLDEGDLVIRAEYSGVNYKDALAATGAGKIMRDFPKVGGIDVAGEVVSAAGRFKPGEKVLITGFDLGVAHDGGFAEYVRAPEKWALALPPNLSAREAMLVGTAGFTAALSVLRLEENGLTPADGKVVVLGATGGVGSFAVAFLAALGYQVTAVTGKSAAADYLKNLGASEVLLRDDIERGDRPLEKALWAGAVDPVGGDWLAWLTRTLAPNASVAVSGLTGGIELRATVMPFILRGVSILGVDSVFCPMARREKTWARIAGEMKPKNLDSVAAAEVGLDDLPAVFPKLLKGEMRGRTLVRLS